MILAIDPSGNFKDGKGITGFFGREKNLVVYGSVKAKEYKTKEEYYKAIARLLKCYHIRILVIEDFTLYEQTAQSFTNQSLETSELIGFIENTAIEHKIKVVRQKASLIKYSLTKPEVLKSIINNERNTNFLDYKTSKDGKILWYYNLTRINNHTIDAMRHYAYYINKR